MSAEECIRHAETFECLAARTRSAADRDMLLLGATNWRKLAGRPPEGARVLAFRSRG